MMSRKLLNAISKDPFGDQFYNSTNSEARRFKQAAHIPLTRLRPKSRVYCFSKTIPIRAKQYTSMVMLGGDLDAPTSI